jgi:hypothetical protein
MSNILETLFQDPRIPYSISKHSNPIISGNPCFLCSLQIRGAIVISVLLDEA